MRAHQFFLHARRTLTTSFEIRVLKSGFTKCQICPARGHIAPNLTTRAPFLILAGKKTVYGLHPNKDHIQSLFLLLVAVTLKRPH